MNRNIIIAVAFTSAACTAPVRDIVPVSDASDVDPDTGNPPDCDAPVISYFDADGDGSGDDQLWVEACEVPPGHVLTGGDCNDLNAAIAPTAAEQCNGTDDNCNGIIDEDLVDLTWYPDDDGDGFGRTGDGIDACAAPDETWVTEPNDCNDEVPTINPEATELCNGSDDDCDGSVDEDTEETTWYPDADGDGYGRTEDAIVDCTPPDETWVTEADDCNDTDVSIHPRAPDVCNGIDDDCDGYTDEDAESITWYPDADGDGYGGSSDAVTGCSAPVGHVTTALDCNDDDPTVYPGASESITRSDSDCNGIDDDVMTTEAHARLDGSSPTSALGTSIAGGHDLDDDGITDLLVGIPGNSAVAIFSGNPSAEALDLDDALLVASGDTPDSLFGQSVSFVDDFTGDGAVEMAIGEPMLATGAGGTGRVTIVLGPLDGSETGDSTSVSVDAVPGEHLGSVVEYLGSPGPGVAYVAAAGTSKIFGSSGVMVIQASAGSDRISTSIITEIGGATSDDDFGHAILGGIDVNGDGLEDVAIGAPGGACAVSTADGEADGGACGTTYVFMAPFGATLSAGEADLVLQGSEPASEFGYALANAHDWDDDGTTDILIGSPGHSTDSGRVYVMNPSDTSGDTSGDIESASMAILEGESGRLGAAVQGVGDADDDGFNDAIVGAPDYDASATATGAAFIYWGTVGTGTFSPGSSMTSIGASGQFGSSLQYTTNLTDSTVFDFVVGSPAADVDDGGSAEVETGSIWFFPLL